MSFEKFKLCINTIAIALLFSLAIVPIESNELTKGVTTFATELYEQCAKTKPGNMIISPLSVASSLALLMQAASGSTYDELRIGLRMNIDDKEVLAEQFNDFYSQLQQSVGRASLSIANQIYLQQGREINSAFDEIATTKFESGVETLNFENGEQSAEVINRFVEGETHGKIRDFVKPNSLDANTVMFLVNAIYFRGNWKTKFNKNRTREAEFYISETETVRSQFMTTKSTFNYAKLQDLNASGLEMKYANSTMSFVILLPTSRTGLRELEENLRNYDLTIIKKRLNPRKVDVTIPKFKIEYEIDLSMPLKEMGMAKIFSHDADLSGILADADTGGALKVSQVLHKAIIEINEKGAEAAATTGVKVVKKSSAPKFLKFNANHGFVYYIYDAATDTVIFSGRFEKVEK